AQELARYRKEKKEDKAGATATAVPNSTMDADPVAEAPDPNLPAAALPRAGQRDFRKQLGKAGRGPAFDMVAQLAQAKLVRAIGSERQLQEVMAEFWFNHFNVFAGKQNEAALLPAYEQRIRELALGKFADLLAAGGEDDGNAVLDLLSHHPSTARFISRKLVQRFVSDDPPEALVQRAADAFSSTGGDIRSVLRAIFESPEMWSRRALRAKVRTPLELVAGSVRALGARVDDPMALARA